MMKILVTGANGTVGQVLVAQLEAAGQQVVKWDRQAVSVADQAAVANYVGAINPEAIFHLATASISTGLENEGFLVNVRWSAQLARLMAERGGKFLFTSSVMVFTDDAKGPFSPESEPDAVGGYGGEKREAETAVLQANSNAIVARIGWQIGDAPGSNNMIDYLTKQEAENREIRASTRWLPATSFLHDTAATLIKLLDMAGGIYLVNSNQKWSFFQIVTALNQKHGDGWRIVPTEDFVYDQRMLDERVPIPTLEASLPQLLS